jgi:hypothetical protein
MNEADARKEADGADADALMKSLHLSILAVPVLGRATLRTSR